MYRIWSGVRLLQCFGGLYVDNECDPSNKASAQGLFMLMTNGLGPQSAHSRAGAVVNHYCHWSNGVLVGDWDTTWLIFAGYALVVAVLFFLVFKNPEKKPMTSRLPRLSMRTLFPTVSLMTNNESELF